MPAPWHFSSPTHRVRKFCVGSWENNVYVVACAQTSRAVIIDAAAEADRILAEVADVNPTAIVTTHGHFDHVGAAREVADRLGIPFHMSPHDADLAKLQPDEPLVAGDIELGATRLEAVATPGHTVGSVTLLIPGVAFTGDTLFPGGPGATRSPGSSFEQILTSIETKLFTLPEDTIVMPGHGLDTTIGTEAPSLQAWRERGW